MSAYDQIEARVKEKIGRALLKRALQVQAQHKRNLSRSNPRPHTNPAPRGEYPRGRTWNLRDSVVIRPAALVEIISSGAVTVGVTANAKYGVILGARGWKSLIDTVHEMGLTGGTGNNR